MFRVAEIKNANRHGQGANMPSRLWAEALPHIEASVESKRAYAAAIPKGGGQELRVIRSRYCESDVVSVRVFRETLENGPLTCGAYWRITPQTRQQLRREAGASRGVVRPL